MASLEEVVYDLAKDALTEQESQIDDLRRRSGRASLNRAMAVSTQPKPKPETPPKREPLSQDIFISEKRGLDNSASGLTTLDKAVESLNGS